MTLGGIKRFMAIGAHSDDVELRCGATFARLTREGQAGCYVVAVENAYVGGHCCVRDSREALAIRRAETTRAAGLLGATRLEWLQFKSYYFSTAEPTSKIHPSFESLAALNEELREAQFEGLPPVANAGAFPQCRERLATLIRDFAPQAVFTHSPDDRHPDHYALSRFVEERVRELRGEGTELDVYFWEPGSGGAIAGFHPNLFVEVAAQDVLKKQQAIDGDTSQFPPGLVNHLATDRARAYGALAGVPYAEAFRVRACPPDGPWAGQSGFMRQLAEAPLDKVVERLP